MNREPYRSYMFFDKDPVIDEVRTLVQKAHGGAPKITRKMLKLIERGGGPKVGTTSKWFFGDTRRPQNPSVESAGRALGFKRDWVPLSTQEKAAIVKALKSKPKKKNSKKK